MSCNKNREHQGRPARLCENNRGIQESGSAQSEDRDTPVSSLLLFEDNRLLPGERPGKNVMLSDRGSALSDEYCIGTKGAEGKGIDGVDGDPLGS